MSSLIGHPARNAGKKRRSRDQTDMDVTTYGAGKAATFFGAGRRTTDNENNTR